MAESVLNFHQGQALLIVAGTYPLMKDVLYEEVQNALDEGATQIWIIVNQKYRQVTVQDNGNGASVAKFEKALSSVGRTVKKNDKLGRFGRGLVSPLGKCTRFTFTSTPKQNPQQYRCWKFVTVDIEREGEKLRIPNEPVPDLRFDLAGAGRVGGMRVVPWRTEVRIESYSEDRHIGHIDADTLHEGILDRFSSAMRKLGTVIHLKIRRGEGGKDIEREFQAESFMGKPLDEFTTKDKDAGVTTFRLYIARRTEKGRKGRVLIGEADNEYRMPFGTFAFAAKNWLESDAAEALSSGIFEGEILTEHAKLHASRKKFEEDQALVGLCGAIDDWYRRVGKKYYSEAQELRREELLQQCGVRTLEVLKSMLGKPEFDWLQKVFSSIRFGTVTVDHTKVRSARGAPDDLIAVRAREDGPSHGGDNERAKGKPTELPGDTPFFSVGPHGAKRRPVRDNSIGLGLSHDELGDPNLYWEFDERMGIVRINTRHPVWELVERSGRLAIMRFQELLVVQALVLQTMPPELRDQQRMALDAIVKPFAFTITEGDVVAGRKLGRKPTKK